jgi:hypothetical protein
MILLEYNDKAAATTAPRECGSGGHPEAPGDLAHLLAIVNLA